MFVKIFQVSADQEMGKYSELVGLFSTEKLSQIPACLISACTTNLVPRVFSLASRKNPGSSWSHDSQNLIAKNKGGEEQ